MLDLTVLQKLNHADLTVLQKLNPHDLTVLQKLNPHDLTALQKLNWNMYNKRRIISKEEEIDINEFIKDFMTIFEKHKNNNEKEKEKIYNDIDILCKQFKNVVVILTKLEDIKTDLNQYGLSPLEPDKKVF